VEAAGSVDERWITRHIRIRMVENPVDPAGAAT
jgi:hypothetical protein